MHTSILKMQKIFSASEAESLTGHVILKGTWLFIFPVDVAPIFHS